MKIIKFKDITIETDEDLEIDLQDNKIKVLNKRVTEKVVYVPVYTQDYQITYGDHQDTGQIPGYPFKYNIITSDGDTTKIEVVADEADYTSSPFGEYERWSRVVDTTNEKDN